MTSSFGAMVRDQRDRVGLTQEELAERTGLSVRAIRNLEQGRTSRPQLATVRLLADSLGLSSSSLVAAARGPLSGRDAVLLLAEVAGRSRVLAEPAAAASIASACGGDPVAVRAVGLLVGGLSLAEVASRLVLAV